MSAEAGSDEQAQPEPFDERIAVLRRELREVKTTALRHTHTRNDNGNKPAARRLSICQLPQYRSKGSRGSYTVEHPPPTLRRTWAQRTTRVRRHESDRGGHHRPEAAQGSAHRSKPKGMRPGTSHTGTSRHTPPTNGQFPDATAKLPLPAFPDAQTSSRAGGNIDRGL